MSDEIGTLIRLLVAAVLGGLVGLERERHSQPAGLRTHIILSLGAALAMAISIKLALQYAAPGTRGDPSRLAAQVVSGIGFLGAGAIIRFGANIKGLTTATSLWTVGVVGLAVGAGFLTAAIFATALLMFTLTIVDGWEKRVIVHTATRAIAVRGVDDPSFIEHVRAALGKADVEIKALSFTRNVQTRETSVKVVAKIRDHTNEQRLTECLAEVPGCRDLSVD